ncbi:hypothetical protein SAMN05444483_1146 [Salegentibacter echinorum]|uniref:Transcriptional regulator, TetR family n=1 Tax=Salegentibacter echinorum TaxID=1073325 RepID=A0A1M5KAV0_SALEC|nr:hypothetical protein [Salegentibacter echinorum]SHG49976.1 hypothetical protein SAMN05444483_1146 [Salegentibacter echinorum]
MARQKEYKEEEVLEKAMNLFWRNGFETTSMQMLLHEIALSVAQSRGNITRKELEPFFAAGYNQRHLLEIILGLSQKVISNYTNYIAEMPLDKGFEKYAWRKH